MSCPKPKQFQPQPEESAPALVSPLTRAEAKLLSSVKSGRADCAARLKRLRSKRCHHRGKCFSQSVAFLRPETPNRSFHARRPCNNLLCENCRRDWEVKQLKRAENRLLGEATILYIGVIRGRSWKTTSTALYRAALASGYDDGPTGYGRCFQPDDSVLVVARFAFPGLVPVLPGVAWKRFADAIEAAPIRKHCVRWCLEWRAETPERSGHAILTYTRPIADVAAEAVKIGGTVRPAPGGFHVYLPPETPAEVVRDFWYFVSGAPCSSLGSVKTYCPNCYSDLGEPTEPAPEPWTRSAAA